MLIFYLYRIAIENHITSRFFIAILYYGVFMKDKITSINNQNIKNIKKLLFSSRYRYKENKFIIEGARICCDAYKNGVEILEIFCTYEAIEKYNVYLKEILEKHNSFIISKEVMHYISDTESPQGVFCICRMQKRNINFNSIGDKVVILENIQDPSNLGAIVRTAEALGLNDIIMSSDCCDIYNPKVLRGSMGSIFRINHIISNDFNILFFNLKDIGFKIFASVPDDSVINISKVDFSGKIAVCIGNEGNGLKKETISLCSKKITIPMRGKSESLNASSA